jgi:hypothetical protein
MKGEGMEDWKPRYSGPDRSGICICGHRWDDHHLGVVMNLPYYEKTGEEYVPQECEYFGFNEMGGMENKDGKWIEHCGRYRDSLEEPRKEGKYCTSHENISTYSVEQAEAGKQQ